MLNEKKFFTMTAAVFIAAEIILGVIIQFVIGYVYSAMTVLSIALALVFVCLNSKKTRKHLLLIVAMSFTLIADVFLCGFFNFEQCQLVAMLLFLVVQACYFLRTYFEHKTETQKFVHLLVRISLSIIAVLATALVLKEKTNALAVISTFYYANLLTNIIFAFIERKQSLILAIGLLLFAFCDLFVGLDVLAFSFFNIEQGSLLYFLVNLPFNTAWAFYVPAQTLLALSIKDLKN